VEGSRSVVHHPGGGCTTAGPGDRQGIEGGANDTDSDLFETLYANIGAYVMGRGMFDIGEEPWGDEPSFQALVTCPWVEFRGSVTPWAALGG
jgi:hypothetical protein